MSVEPEPSDESGADIRDCAAHTKLPPAQTRPFIGEAVQRAVELSLRGNKLY